MVWFKFIISLLGIVELSDRVGSDRTLLVKYPLPGHDVCAMRILLFNVRGLCQRLLLAFFAAIPGFLYFFLDNVGDLGSFRLLMRVDLLFEQEVTTLEGDLPILRVTGIFRE
jgi:hypothetical protein